MGQLSGKGINSADLSLGGGESIIQLWFWFAQPGISQESSALEVCWIRSKIKHEKPPPNNVKNAEWQERRRIAQ